MADPMVYHFVMVKGRQEPAQGERIASLVVTPDFLATLPPGTDLAAAIRQERTRWAQVIAQAGFHDGYAVVVHRERGFHRSIFPGVALGGLTDTPARQLILPGGTHA